MKNKKVVSIFFSIFLVIGIIAFVVFAKSNNELKITYSDILHSKTGDFINYNHKHDNVNMNSGDSGQGVIWDFSKLGSDFDTYKMSIVKVDCEKAPDNKYFPNATSCYFFESKESDVRFEMYSYDDEKTNSVGHVTKIMITNCSDIPVDVYPLFYGKKYEYTSRCVNEVSEKIVKTQVKSEVDGEGVLVFPDGEKVTDVLRIKNEIINSSTKENEISYRYLSKQQGSVLLMMPNRYVLFKRKL